ncbi:hypothetical protein EON83_21390 [bacterium]|nr:MAG: hypothetical protein EON83_21390 [bacterium]
MNLPLLKIEVEKPEFTLKSVQEIAGILNASTTPYFVEVDTPDMTNFLMNTGLYAKLLAVYRDHPNKLVRVAAEGALDLAQSQIKFVNVSNGTIQATLPILVENAVWTQADADSVVNYARRYKSRAFDLFGVEVTEGDIRAARLLDRAQAEVQTLEDARAVVSQLEYRQAQFRAGIDPDTEGGV